MSDIKNYPTRKQKCVTCPFRVDDDGMFYDPSLVSELQVRSFTSSHLCHHPTLYGEAETHICRGSRDYQIEMFFRLGYLEEPTDQAWEKAKAELKLT